EADRQRVLHAAADQRIDERRFADARRPEERRRAAETQYLAQLRNAVAAQRARGKDRNTLGNRCELVGPLTRIVAEIGLVHDDDRRRAALPREREIPLETPDVEIAIERRHEQDAVDVGRNDLLLGRSARGGT